ncbi:MAG TPA: cytochrome c3 family protein [Candidatus Acidoferrum sp.]|nr:cytochrome c3 family protein [Candidatus Acidoferrum sp.]
MTRRFWTIFLSGLLLTVLTPAIRAEETNNCLTCHQQIEEEDGPAHKFPRDIHYQKGIFCVDCHGGDASLDDMDAVRKVKGYRGAPSHLEVPEFCARCHSDATYMRNHNPSLPTDQLEKYKTSIHGKRLFGEKDTKVANCISCHSVHEIGDAKMPYSSTYPMNIPGTCGKCHADSSYMAPYNIPTDQLDKYTRSVHGKALLVKKDLGAPACNSCHGNHGAAPPGVASLSAVCGNCHALQADLFNASPHEKAFAANNYPMCETCHSNHLIEHPTDSLVGTKPPALCANCHSDDDGTKGFAVAEGSLASIEELVQHRAVADSLLLDAHDKGMMTTDEEFKLREVDQDLIETRTLVHSLDLTKLQPKAQEGLAKADTVKVRSAGLIDEYYYRRKGLGLATLFITIAAIGLYLKIRKLR